VTATATDPDGNTSEFSRWIAVVASPESDLSVAKTDLPDPVLPDGIITYAITLNNSGPDTAAGITLSDTVPPGTVFQSITSPAGWNCATPPVGGTGNITCNGPNLAASASAAFSLVVRVDATAAPGATISNTAAVSGTVTDPNSANDSATAVTTVTGGADLAIVKTGPASAGPGGNINYTVTVTNNGPAAAQNVAFNDPIPANTTFVSEAQTTGPPFTCTNPPQGGVGTVSCSSPALNPGASATFTISVQVNPAAAGTITNTATVSAGSADPNPGNNSATVNTTLQATSAADLRITKSDAPDPVAAGGTITYTITVTNNGPAAATGITLEDTIPAGTVFLSAGGTGACSLTGQLLRCSLQDLPVGQSVTATLGIQASPTPGIVTNSVVVSALEPDPNTADNSASASTTVFQLQALGPIYTQGASYRIVPPPMTLAPIYTQGASYRIAVEGELGPIFTQGAS
jgi:uncharacterized repeat protein (TIGR01451 family)